MIFRIKNNTLDLNGGILYDSVVQDGQCPWNTGGINDISKTLLGICRIS